MVNVAHVASNREFEEACCDLVEARSRCSGQFRLAVRVRRSRRKFSGVPVSRIGSKASITVKRCDAPHRRDHRTVPPSMVFNEQRLDVRRSFVIQGMPWPKPRSLFFHSNPPRHKPRGQQAEQHAQHEAHTPARAPMSRTPLIGSSGHGPWYGRECAMNCGEPPGAEVVESSAGRAPRAAALGAGIARRADQVAAARRAQAPPRAPPSRRCAD